MVNLDSATAARGVLETARQRGVEVEVGGGVRTLAAAERWLAAGAAFVVLGSVAVQDPDAAQVICAALPGRCLASLDVRGDTAQAQGWTEGAGSAATHLERWAGWPLAGLVRTDVDLDGMMGGPDLGGLEKTVRAFPGPVIASGGISTVDDIVRCAKVGAAGAIVGRASTRAASTCARPSSASPMSDEPGQADHPLPRRRPRPGGQGRPVRQPPRRG